MPVVDLWAREMGWIRLETHGQAPGSTDSWPSTIVGDIESNLMLHKQVFGHPLT